MKIPNEIANFAHSVRVIAPLAFKFFSRCTFFCVCVCVFPFEKCYFGYGFIIYVKFSVERITLICIIIIVGVFDGKQHTTYVQLNMFNSHLDFSDKNYTFSDGNASVCTIKINCVVRLLTWDFRCIAKCDGIW